MRAYRGKARNHMGVYLRRAAPAVQLWERRACLLLAAGLGLWAAIK